MPGPRHARPRRSAAPRCAVVLGLTGALLANACAAGARSEAAADGAEAHAAVASLVSVDGGSAAIRDVPAASRSASREHAPVSTVVTVLDGDSALTRSTTASTIRGAFQEWEHWLGTGQHLSLPLDTALTGAPLSVSVYRESVDTQQVIEEIPYGTTVLSDPSRYTGEIEVRTYGVPGQALHIYRVTTLGGVETSRGRFVSTEQPPVDRVEVHGTRPRPRVPAAAPRARGQAPEGHMNPADAQALGQTMAAERGWTGDEWTCLDNLFTRESNWRSWAANPRSSAFGIPQAMLSLHPVPADFRTNAATQITWGLDYIAGRYRTPCRAWAHFERHGWY